MKRTKRIIIVLLGIVLFCVPFIVFGDWSRSKKLDYTELSVLKGYEYYCTITKETPMTSDDYFHMEEALRERMPYAQIEAMTIHYGEDRYADDGAVLVVDYEGDFFLDPRTMFEIFTSKGELMLASVDKDDNVKIWLTNEDFAAAMDNSSYSPTEGNDYGVLLRVEEESLDKYKEMIEYSSSTNGRDGEIFVFLDGEIIDSMIYVDTDTAPSKNVGYGNVLIRTKSMEENTKVLVVGATKVLEANIELRDK